MSEVSEFVGKLDGNRRDYTRRYVEKLRTFSRTLGYAITVHGSERRDLDLVAIPWTDDAVPVAEDFVALLSSEFGLYVKPDDGVGHNLPVCNPHGRLSFALCGADLPTQYIDLSVMPCGKEATR